MSWLRLPSEIDIIGRLIGISHRIEWKMRCELLANFFDTTNEAAGEVTRSKSFRDDIDDAMPEFLPDALVDTAVPKDDEFSASGNDEEEDAVAVLCTSHSKTSERFLGGF